MCFGKRSEEQIKADQPKAPVQTPSYAQTDTDKWMNITSEDQGGGTGTLRVGMGKPPAASNPAVKGGGKRHPKSGAIVDADNIRM